MFVDFFRGFTATHKTILLVTAMVVPGAVYGAVTFQAVSIVDPNTGATAFVNSGRQLYVYDPIAGFANNPLNYVKITGVALGDGVFRSIYTVPAGKALVIKSIAMSYFHGFSGNDNYTYFWEKSESAVSFIAGFDDVNVAGEHNVGLGNGYYLQSGENVEYSSTNSGSGDQMETEFSIEGYLAPSTDVRANASLEAPQQFVRVGEAPKK